jgi:hypothetical protein
MILVFSTLVVSNEIFSDGEETFLYVDNGEGYEEKSNGVGLEFIIDSALGGETHFQLAMGGKQTVAQGVTRAHRLDQCSNDSWQNQHRIPVDHCTYRDGWLWLLSSSPVGFASIGVVGCSSYWGSCRVPPLYLRLS